jgi:hypothetical protein
MNSRTRGPLALVLAVALSPVARGDVVTDWNDAVTAVTLGGPSAPQIRIYALVHAAIHDAVNAVDRRYQPYVVDLKAPPGTSVDAAAAAAAHGVLLALVPTQKATIDAALAASLARVPDGKARSEGIAAGAQVADRLLAARKDDGFAAKVEVRIAASAPGVWQLTPGWPAPLLAQWPQMKPMVIASLADFEAGAPPAPSTERFARDYMDDRVDASFTYPLQFGVTRAWKSFSDVEAEVVNARVWGGIHYRSTDEVSTALGRKIGEHVVAKALLPVKVAER